ncbi:unnamed protein product [Vitrella brassicaformis CCMP3155]|uniref:Uncharacterized protein n=1 Tax=Vitrella brassicaformis (strain CCMP3155) TaxID=1169540 RepID=A0A0G4F506_VITBC|nr:unnamed protein product [Vitrella brassicaformis CCMP3155]|eukprot:CEM06804.1 unnamed protein product [Vitrella brassicaformis CCMP3155]
MRVQLSLQCPHNGPIRASDESRSAPDAAQPSARSSVTLRYSGEENDESSAAAAATGGLLPDANGGVCDGVRGTLGSADHERLQMVYEDILARPWAHPTHVQRLHAAATRLRAERQRCVDQSALDAGKMGVMFAHGVVYALLSSNSPHCVIIASRVPAGLDFMERWMVSRQFNTREPYKWMHESGFENLYVYLLEKLPGPGRFFGDSAARRRRHWERVARTVDDDSPLCFDDGTRDGAYGGAKLLVPAGGT